MPRPALTWLITDTHFYHDALVELCGRPANFTDLIQKHWRLLVMPQDEVIHLGDVILYKYPELLGMMEALPGRKVLVMGNHDHKSRHWYMRNGFAYAADSLIIGTTLFNHRPVDTLPVGVEYCIHGHLHNVKHRAAGASPRNRLLALEHTGYQPVRLLDFMKTHEKHTQADPASTY